VTLAARILASEHTLVRALARLRFGAPVTHVYNPLEYARRPHAAYVRRYARTPIAALYFGMNPGPYGMAQTGVPFGEVAHVRDWLGIEAEVEKPRREHPKRPIEGFACRRSEVSGARLWGAVRAHYEKPERFFRRAFLANYCPLVFMEASGRNRTPDQLPASEREPLLHACDEHLRRIVELLRPAHVIGIGRFAEARARIALAGSDVRIGTILHPSPASPAANRGWAAQAKRELAQLGVCGAGSASGDAPSRRQSPAQQANA
jgi:single-strand selective monofunctional uracil DNA glycosylase